MDHSGMLTTIGVILGLSAVANILLVLCLAHTWRFWRQVKYYIILMTIGNFLDFAVTQGVLLAGHVSNGQSHGGSTGLCRFLMFAVVLGPSLSAMSVAALSVHVLLTSITGNQGSRLRHVLVLGLFVLLALPLPLAMLPLSDLETYHYGPEVRSICHLKLESGEEVHQMMIGSSVAMVFFPVSVTLLASLATGVLLCTASRGTVKGDEHKSDLILTCLLGAVLLVFGAPFYIHEILMHTQRDLPGSQIYIMIALHRLISCFPFITAVITIVFAYVHAFRNRGAGEFLMPTGGTSSATGERQKLVN